jgi:hypothetical protein
MAKGDSNIPFGMVLGLIIIAIAILIGVFIFGGVWDAAAQESGKASLYSCCSNFVANDGCNDIAGNYDFQCNNVPETIEADGILTIDELATKYSLNYGIVCCGNSDIVVTKSKLGESCTQNIDCASGTCTADVCVE